MGCFSTCFPKSKNRKSLKPIAPCLVHLLQRDEDIEPLQLTDIIDLKTDVNPIDQLPLNEGEKREKLNISGRKKVRFDLNVKIYEGLPAQDDEFEGDFLVNTSNAQEEGGKERQCNSDSSSSSSLFSLPLDTYRYQDCRDSDDEFDQLVSDDGIDDYEDEDEEDDDEWGNEVNNNNLVGQEESSDSLFSLSVDSRKHKISTERDDKEVNSPAPVRIGGDEAERMKKMDSVLQTVENKAQWKAIKARAKLASQTKSKENTIPVSELHHPKSSYQEIAVDESLSTWLVGSEAASHDTSNASSGSVGNSPCSNRTNSCKELSANLMTPIRLPIGTVGSYWSHTAQIL